MSIIRKTTSARSRARTLAWGAAALGALALANHAVARLAEHRHPPEGSLVEVDGVRLHYSDRGTGQPVVLIHGNAVTGDDYNTSGVADLLLARHRVIIFDRPGFGYSDRPRGRLWTANQQAELLHKALRQLGVERPVIVGHSWGAIVALALAEAHPGDTAALVLLSGYYFWTLRPDVLPVALGAAPVIGDILRYTISPLFGWLTMPLFKRLLFSPAAVPARFQAEYSPAMALRPSQIRATSLDGALDDPGRLEPSRQLQRPVHAGGDHGRGRRQGGVQALGRAAPGQHQGQHPAGRERCRAHGPSPRTPSGCGGYRVLSVLPPGQHSSPRQLPPDGCRVVQAH